MFVYSWGCLLSEARKGHWTPWSWSHRWLCGLPCECLEFKSKGVLCKKSKHSQLLSCFSNPHPRVKLLILQPQPDLTGAGITDMGHHTSFVLFILKICLLLCVYLHVLMHTIWVLSAHRSQKRVGSRSPGAGVLGGCEQPSTLGTKPTSSETKAFLTVSYLFSLFILFYFFGNNNYSTKNKARSF